MKQIGEIYKSYTTFKKLLSTANARVNDTYPPYANERVFVHAIDELYRRQGVSMYLSDGAKELLENIANTGEV